MSLLEKLDSQKNWDAFYKFKSESAAPGKGKLKSLKAFIDKKEYHNIAKKIIDGEYRFSYPLKTTVNKKGTNKKRVIYRFQKKESFILKLLTFLLYKYDRELSPNCYSFRRGLCAQSAIKDIVKIKNNDKKYVLKIDIHDYFNSVPSERLSEEIALIINDDKPLCTLLQNLVTINKACLKSAESKYSVIEENRGAMAGIPVSAFFANIYLRGLDRIFFEKNIPYFRYSDDILILCDTKEDVEEYKTLIFNYIEERGLTINQEKLRIYSPGEKWEFLGFSYQNGTIDIAEVSVEKIKAKIKRKAKAMLRRKKRKNEDFFTVAADLADCFNRKFYDDENEDGFTWSRWYFPLLTTAESLKKIDLYLEQYLRFLSTGRHTKKNFSVRYKELKELGFRSLVYEYYQRRWNKNQRRES